MILIRSYISIVIIKTIIQAFALNLQNISIVLNNFCINN